MSAGDRCGGRWNCVLPAGHNMGKADIPENHQPPSAGDRDTLAAILAEHDALRSHGPGTGWFCRGCGQKMTDWPTPQQCRPHESAMEVVHRAHLADVLLASDWLREQRAEAWKAGHGWCDDGDLGCDHEPFTPNPYLED